MISFKSNAFNLNYRHFLYKLYKLKRNDQIIINIKKVFDSLNLDYAINKNDKYDDVTILFLCYLSYKISSLELFYEIFTWLLVKDFMVSYDNDKYNFILNIKNDNNFIFKNLNYIHLNWEKENIDKEKINIENYFSISDFLEINNVFIKILQSKKINKFEYMGWFNFEKNFKIWPKGMEQLFWKIYIFFLGKKEKNIEDVRENLIKLYFSKKYYMKFEFLLSLIALNSKLKLINNKIKAADLHQLFSNFFNNENKNLAIESENIWKNKSVLIEEFIFLAASYLDNKEYEKLILLDYENLLKVNKEQKSQYLQIKLFKFRNIYQLVNDESFEYNKKEFKDAIEKYNEIKKEKILYPNRLIGFDNESSHTRITIHSVSDYEYIGIKESDFRSFSIQEKVKFIDNFLNDKDFSKSSHINILIKIISIEKDLIDSEEWINFISKNFKSSNINRKYLFYYFFNINNIKEYNGIAISIEESIHQNGANFKENIKVLTDFILKFEYQENLEFFCFTFFNDANFKIYMNLSKIIYKIFCWFNKSERLNDFNNIFFDKLNIFFNKNYKKISQIFQKFQIFFDIGFNEYFKLIAIFIPPANIIGNLYFKKNYLFNYLFHFNLVKYNKKDKILEIADLINIKDYLYVCWFIFFVSRTFWCFSCPYIKYIKPLIECLLYKNANSNFENYLLKLIAFAKRNKLTEKNFKINFMDFSGRATIIYYCYLVLLFFYLSNKKNSKILNRKIYSFFALDDNILFLFKDLLNSYYSKCLNHSIIKKDAILKFLINFAEYIKKEKIIEKGELLCDNIVQFTNEEKNQLKDFNQKYIFLLSKNNLLLYKAIYYLIIFHIKPLEELKKIIWFSEGIKIVFKRLDFRDFDKVILRYKNNDEVKEKINFFKLLV